MATAVAPAANGRAGKADVVEQVIAQGDLDKLSAEERVHYYMQVCQSLGLNPLTRPFEYIRLNGKLTLYARRDCADQLRCVHGISIDKPDIDTADPNWILVTVVARDSKGRTDSDVGAVNKKDMRGDFGNALMKAVTKAKRRVTLSLCGLGMLDETEVETIPDAQPVDAAPPAKPAAAPALPHKPDVATAADVKELEDLIKKADADRAAFLTHYQIARLEDMPAAHVTDARTKLKAKAAKNRATTDQAIELDDLGGRLQMTGDQWGEIFRSLNVAGVNELSRSQAAGLIGELKDKLEGGE